MKTTWGMKSPHKRKRTVLRIKVRWEKLGFQNPAEASSAPSIDDIRRQITSAASHGLSDDTRFRSQQNDRRPKTGS